MNKREREVLHSLCDGDITFLEASSQLGVTEEIIEEMLENYSWLPSPQRLAELNETEMETLSYIREICQPIELRSNAHTEIQFNDAKILQNALYPIYFTPISIGKVTMNYIESIPNKTELDVPSYFSLEIFKPESINLSPEDTEGYPIGSSQSTCVHFQLKNTQTTETTLLI